MDSLIMAWLGTKLGVTGICLQLENKHDYRMLSTRIIMYVESWEM